MMRTARGRVVTRQAWQHFGLAPSEAAEDAAGERRP